MDRNLSQDDVALFCQVSKHCVARWENNRHKPQMQYMPRVVEFLGYDPTFPNLETLEGQILQFRNIHGLTYGGMGKLLGMKETTVSDWECGKINPSKSSLQKLIRMFSGKKI